MNQTPFSVQAQTFGISATGVASAAVQMGVRANGVRIVNEGPNVAFVAIGNSAAVLATVPGAAPGAVTSTPVPPGTDQIFSMGFDAAPNWVSAICRNGGTAALSITPGEGQ